MSVVGGHPKKKNTQISVMKQQKTPFLSLIITSDD